MEEDKSEKKLVTRSKSSYGNINFHDVKMRINELIADMRTRKEIADILCSEFSMGSSCAYGHIKEEYEDYAKAFEDRRNIMRESLFQKLNGIVKNDQVNFKHRMEGIKLIMTLYGLNKEDVSVTVNNNVQTVKEYRFVLKKNNNENGEIDLSDSTGLVE